MSDNTRDNEKAHIAGGFIIIFIIFRVSLAIPIYSLAARRHVYICTYFRTAWRIARVYSVITPNVPSITETEPSKLKYSYRSLYEQVSFIGSVHHQNNNEQTQSWILAHRCWCKVSIQINRTILSDAVWWRCSYKDAGMTSFNVAFTLAKSVVFIKGPGLVIIMRLFNDNFLNFYKTYTNVCYTPTESSHERSQHVFKNIWKKYLGIIIKYSFYEILLTCLSYLDFLYYSCFYWNVPTVLCILSATWCHSGGY